MFFLADFFMFYSCLANGEITISAGKIHQPWILSGMIPTSSLQPQSGEWGNKSLMEVCTAQFVPREDPKAATCLDFVWSKPKSGTRYFCP